MNALQNILNANPKYLDLLGKAQALKLLKLFSEIENGKYYKEEVHKIQINGIRYPVYLRAIRADMQSFINTFIDPYLQKKPYLKEMKFVIDAGTNIGYTAILFANWWPNSRIICLEPDEENYELTIKNTFVYPNVTVINAALWNKNTQLKIEAGQEDGFVVREIGNDEKLNSKNLTNGISIDHLLIRYQCNKIDFLKLNVEGSEKEIFSENLDNWLPKTQTMLVELHDGKNPGCSRTVFNAISKYNFAVAETASYGILFTQAEQYESWYAKWYKDEIYEPNIDKKRFPEFYLDK